jgi:AraC family transcriptional regulator
LCRSFRNVTGHTLHRQLTVLRLRASLEAVAERGQDLTHVALDHGFNSHSHFSAAFRREYGMTPSAWRARVHGASS